MHTTYYEDDDILVLHLSDKPISREVSQDWNIHISYATDGTAVEIVIIDAAAIGAFPFIRSNHSGAESHSPEALKPLT